ncbi:tRNA (pseudouridine(54)-N(1))-methyltransferase TrmY [Methanosalsum natronophilum]|uniref:tRNA (pseudouridine(54)-N(1))-methyltransferase TrmY n=1 Tax=Methanosalsum natronophilum TaxID=768733 RepID=UPI0021679C6E|nr:tRNA (pseudouridine(54)-N(1))-methyltransferase TrmY [Methanosalsum natronophilum]MCS3924519.1 tRNA (pseudouridine54-N1)-methyltransferase [Methanosalsum natronophilum]
MRDFLIIGNRALTSPDFSLNDLPGSAGRMDVLCRCINSALFLSHDMRRDVQIHLFLQGPPNPGIAIRFNGSELKYLNPDERSAASLIKKALNKDIMDGNLELESTPGVWVRKTSLNTIMTELSSADKPLYYLREDGTDIRKISILSGKGTYVLGDDQGLTSENELIVLNHKPTILSLSPISLHSDHCITILNNEIDRVELG